MFCFIGCSLLSCSLFHLLTRLGDGDLSVLDLPALRCMDTEEIRIALDFCRRIGDQRRRSDLVRKELLFVIALSAMVLSCLFMRHFHAAKIGDAAIAEGFSASDNGVFLLRW